MSQASNSIVIASCFSSFRSKPFKQTANGLVTHEKQLTNDTKINYLFFCVYVFYSNKPPKSPIIYILKVNRGHYDGI